MLFNFFLIYLCKFQCVKRSAKAKPCQIYRESIFTTKNFNKLINFEK